MTVGADYDAGPWFLLRAPLCPLDHILERVDRARLRQLFQAPHLREAIELASTSLYDELRAWDRAPGAHPADPALLSYLVRAASRPTPFGLFAGYAIGRIGARLQLRLAPRERWCRRTYLDGGYLAQIAHQVAGDPEFAAALPLELNDSLYRVGAAFRYFALGAHGAAGRPQLVSADADEALCAAVEAARGGIRLDALVEAMCEHAERDEANAYVRELIASELVVVGLGVGATGPPPHARLVADLARVPGTEAVIGALEAVLAGLEAIDAAPLGTTLGRYAELRRLLPSEPARDTAHVFRADLRLSGEFELPAAQVGELAAAIDVVHRLGMGYAAGELDGLRRAFEARYGGDEVPLLEVFDPEIGLDYPFVSGARDIALLDGLGLEDGPNAAPARWSATSAALFAEVMRPRADRHVLDVRTLERAAFVPEPEPLPDAFSATISLVGRPGAAATPVFKYAAGPSGATLMGRFCHGDAALTGLVRAHLAREEALRPGALFAEVAYLDEPGLANIVARPVLRGHEITLRGRSGADPAHVIAATDLLLVVRDGRLTLISRRHRREVIPRITAPHAFSRAENLILYHFLGALQRQGCAFHVWWDWGVLGRAPALPRVVHGDVILAPQRWRLDAADARRLRAGAELAPSVRGLRDRLELPRFVCFGDGDKMFPTDLDNPASVETIPHRLRHAPGVVFQELLYDRLGSPVIGDDGAYANELMIPFVRKAREADPAHRQDDIGELRPAPRAVRHGPGSAWLVARIHTQPRVAARVIARVHQRAIAPGGELDRWFFTYDASPGFHVGLWLHGARAATARALDRLEAAFRGLANDGLAGRLELDTYVRGSDPAAAERDEQLAQLESEAALELEAEVVPAVDPAEAWLVTAVGLDHLLRAAPIDDGRRHDVLARLARDSRARHAPRAELSHALGRNYRGVAAALASWLDAPASEPARRSHAIWECHDARTAALLAALGSALEPGFEPALRRLLAARLGRLIAVAPRPMELVLHDFLRRYYRSKLARQRPGSPQ